jgi:hypothetical protein
MFSHLRVKNSLLFFSYFNQIRISGKIFEKFSIPNFTKVHPQGAEFSHAEGRTNVTQKIVAFHNLANAPKNEGKKRQWPLSVW